MSSDRSFIVIPGAGTLSRTACSYPLPLDLKNASYLVQPSFLFPVLNVANGLRLPLLPHLCSNYVLFLSPPNETLPIGLS